MLSHRPALSGLRATFTDGFDGFSASPTGVEPGSEAPVWHTTYPWGSRTISVNHEAQYYSDASVGVDPFRIVSGILEITAAPAGAGVTLPGGLAYTSGLITTHSTFAQRYGHFEMRAQLPTGAGFWPAFWLLKTDGTWPPEIDVVEAFGRDTQTVYTAMHSGAAGAHTQVGSTIPVADYSNGFHTYGMSWRPDVIRWFIDGTEVFQAATPADMHVPMYMLANLAVGGQGSWPGPTDGTSSATMRIDYIRAYQFDDLVPSHTLTVSQTDAAGNTETTGIDSTPSTKTARSPGGTTASGGTWSGGTSSRSFADSALDWIRGTGFSADDAGVIDFSTRSIRDGLFARAATSDTADPWDGRRQAVDTIKEVRFLDGRLVLDPDAPAAQVVRLYRTALGREPDQDGLNFWTARLEHGGRLSDLGVGFLGSPEFQARFGDPDDAGYVDRLYQNVLGRAADAAGQAYWTQRLQAGASRQDVLAGFSDSAENKAGTHGAIASGIWDRSEAAQQVARLYDTVLGRLPDAAGLGQWCSRLADESAGLEDVAGALSRSSEFVSRHGALSDRDFVDALYRNTLARPGDAAGIEHWMGGLQSGRLSRAGTALAFSESAEHVAKTASLFAGDDPAHHGITLAD